LSVRLWRQTYVGLGAPSGVVGGRHEANSKAGYIAELARLLSDPYSGGAMGTR